METTVLGQRAERRCRTCGSRAPGTTCAECGSAVAPRAEIGVLAEVNNDFGTVDNVYDMGPVMGPEPELVGPMAVQRFPERVPQVAAPPALGPSKAVRRTNAVAYVLAAILVAGMAAALLAVLRT